MDRPKTDESPAEKNTSTASKDTPAPAAPATAATADDRYEPYPGPHFFHGGRNSPIIHVYAVRLQQEGHWKTTQAPGPDWTNAHKRATASYQHSLRPKEGGDVSGIPDQVAWDKLGVPRVSPR